MAASSYTISAWAKDAAALAKPNITLLAVFTALGGMWLSPGELGAGLVVATLLGTAMIVAAANTLNCYVERDSDRFMARTKSRPLPAGRMNPRHALFLGCGLAAISVPLLTFAINPVTGVLGLIALVIYVSIYTPMKQVSPMALWVGAIPGAMPPLLGWTAVTGRIEWPGVILFGIMFIWQLPHFIAISMYREQEYNRAGIKTVPAVRGVAAARREIFFWTAALVPVSLMLVPLNLAGTVYLAAASVLGVVFLIWAFRGFRAEHANRWARGLFLYSLVYLTLLFGALAVDTILA
ncbi:MAG: heme o synthase [Myxococcota bacterium]|nr:heme o synthase [Myxococcota bacterium]